MADHHAPGRVAAGVCGDISGMTKKLKVEAADLANQLALMQAARQQIQSYINVNPTLNVLPEIHDPTWQSIMLKVELRLLRGGVSEMSEKKDQLFEIERQGDGTYTVIMLDEGYIQTISECPTLEDARSSALFALSKNRAYSGDDHVEKNADV
jgi:hypothetical protein